MDLIDAIAYGSIPRDEKEGRTYGFLLGIIMDIGDPQKLGRVKAHIVGQQDNDTTDWLLPIWPGSAEFYARKNDPCIVGFVDGDPNRGFFATFVTTRTQKRPQDFMLLGTTFVGLFNYLIDQFNQLRSDFNGHKHVVPSLTCSATAGSGTATTTASNTGTISTSAAAANKGQAADGSTVPNKTGPAIVLSGNAKVNT